MEEMEGRSGPQRFEGCLHNAVLEPGVDGVTAVETPSDRELS